jgi:hypothetical protein
MGFILLMVLSAYYTAIETVLAITPLAYPVLSACSPSVSFSPPSLMVNLRQVAPNQKKTPIYSLSKSSKICLIL